MYKNELLKLIPFKGLKENTAGDEDMQNLIKVVDEIANKVDFSLLNKEELLIIIDFLSETDSLYGINTPLTDGLEESDFSNFDDNLLLMRLPEYALEIKRSALEQGVVFTKSVLFPKNVSPYEKTKLFFKKINWKLAPSSDEINFLLFLIEDSYNSYSDVSISEKQKKEIFFKIKDYLDFNEIGYDYERICALKLMLEGVTMGLHDKQKSLVDNIDIYNGLYLLSDDSYKEKLSIFRNKNNIIIINDTIDSFGDKIFYLYQSKINFYYDQNREIIKDDPLVQ